MSSNAQNSPAVSLPRYLQEDLKALISYMQENPDFDLKDVMFIAAETGDLRRVKAIAAIDPESLVALQAIDSQISAMHMAAAEGHNDIVEWFATNYPNRRTVKTGLHGENIAHAAVRYLQFETIRMLATKFPELFGEDQKANGGWTPRDLAAQRWAHLPEILDGILGPRKVLRRLRRDPQRSANNIA